MSNLSDLLNPAPSPLVGAPSTGQQPAPLHLDGQDHRTQPSEPIFQHGQNPARQAVMSPGLDVLAAAASSTMPLFSPTQERSSMGEVTFSDDTAKRDVLGRVQGWQNHAGDAVKPSLTPYSSHSPGQQESTVGNAFHSYC